MNGLKFRHNRQAEIPCSSPVPLRLVLFTFFVVTVLALPAARPAQAMQGFQDNMLTPYQSPLTKLVNMCATCHADWNGRETRHNVAVAYWLYEDVTKSTTSVFATLD